MKEKKKILIVHSDLMIGGAESSLIGLLQSLDYSRVDVTLMLLNPVGDLLALVPSEVHLYPTPKPYNDLMLPIKDVVFKHFNLPIALSRLLAKRQARGWDGRTYMTKELAHLHAMKFLPRIEGEYDLALSFIDPHVIVSQKVNAKIRMGWMHTDISRFIIDKVLDEKVWDALDYAVNVSEACNKAFQEFYPRLAGKAISIENVLSRKYIYSRAEAQDVSSEMPHPEGRTNILSVGRFTEAKNFKNVSHILKQVREQGIDAKWYLIGYGNEQEILDAITETSMQEHCIILGKRDNPYPYIKACDIYAQPSIWEGKCVAVREAQILNRPVLITDYATSHSQLTDGYDGVIAPQDNDGCARSLASLIQDKALQERLIAGTQKEDYTNAKELDKIYRLLDVQ